MWYFLIWTSPFSWWNRHHNKSFCFWNKKVSEFYPVIERMYGVFNYHELMLLTPVRKESGRNLGQFLCFSTSLLKFSLTIFLETFSILVCTQIDKRRSEISNLKSCPIVYCVHIKCGREVYASSSTSSQIFRKWLNPLKVCE